jgi:RNA polymerase sigma-70 factor (ECF subfamily)
MTSVALPIEAEDTAPGAQPRRASDDVRLRAMLDKHFNFIWRSLRRFGLTDDRADDAAQQVFVVASRRIESIAPGSEQSFLLRTAMHVASDVRRSASYRREVVHADPAGEIDSGLRPDDALDRRRARVILDGILDAMDLDLRSVFVLFEIEEMTIAEIGALLEIPNGTVASRLRRARERFHTKLARLRAYEGVGP